MAEVQAPWGILRMILPFKRPVSTDVIKLPVTSDCSHLSLFQLKNKISAHISCISCAFVPSSPALAHKEVEKGPLVEKTLSWTPLPLLVQYL